MDFIIDLILGDFLRMSLLFHENFLTILDDYAFVVVANLLTKQVV